VLTIIVALGPEGVAPFIYSSSNHARPVQQSARNGTMSGLRRHDPPGGHRAVLLLHVSAGLLNGVALQRDIELLPYGAKRDVCLALIRPVSWLSQHTALGTPAQALNRCFHPEK